MTIVTIMAVIASATAFFARLKVWSRPQSRALTLALLSLAFYALGQLLHANKVGDPHSGIEDIFAWSGQAFGTIGTCLIGVHVMQAWNLSRFVKWLIPGIAALASLSIPYYVEPGMDYALIYGTIVALIALAVGVSSVGTSVVVFNTSRDSRCVIVGIGLGGVLSSLAALTYLAQPDLYYAEYSPLVMTCIMLSIISYSTSALLNAIGKAVKEYRDQQANTVIRGNSSLRPLVFEDKGRSGATDQIGFTRAG